MVRELYADVAEELHKPAARSVHAHLVALLAEGQVVSDTGAATPDATYSLG